MTAVALLLGPLQADLSAQILYGSLVGNVADASGAVIPGAQVTVTNEQTGATRTGQSNASGVYNFPTVAAGVYTVAVQSDGFRTHSETGVNVGANNVTRVDVALEVGQVTETVEVSASAARLQTDRAEVRAEVDKQDLQNVPVPLGPELPNANADDSGLFSAAECALCAGQPDARRTILRQRHKRPKQQRPH